MDCHQVDQYHMFLGLEQSRLSSFLSEVQMNMMVPNPSSHLLSQYRMFLGQEQGILSFLLISIYYLTLQYSNASYNQQHDICFIILLLLLSTFALSGISMTEHGFSTSKALIDMLTRPLIYQIPLPQYKFSLFPLYYHRLSPWHVPTSRLAWIEGSSCISENDQRFH